MRGRDKRLARLGGAISAAPVLPHVLDEAYAWFADFGELPEDDDHVADAVMQRALRGGDGEITSCRSSMRVAVVHAASQNLPTVREPLFREALDENPLARRMARAAITVEVAYGGNVESPGFAGQHGMPMFGSVGMHVLGYPRRWIQAPYEFQGRRLLARFDELRARLDQRDPKWAERIGAAALAFRTDGSLPTDELTLALVLADAELDAHRANVDGHDVKEVMGWFVSAARDDGAERDEALRLVSEAAKAGKLIWAR